MNLELGDTLYTRWLGLKVTLFDFKGPIHIVCTFPPFCWEVELPTKFSEKGGGGLDRISIFRGGCWERGDDLLRMQLLPKDGMGLKTKNYGDSENSDV